MNICYETLIVNAKYAIPNSNRNGERAPKDEHSLTNLRGYQYGHIGSELRPQKKNGRFENL